MLLLYGYGNHMASRRSLVETSIVTVDKDRVHLFNERLTRQINDIANSNAWKKFVARVARWNAVMNANVRRKGVHPRRAKRKRVSIRLNAIE